MAHYERLEQIDYKSARDVVTEVDHLSEALILDAIRARYPTDAILAEESGEHRAGRRRGADLGQGPGLDRRPARRHRELRQRHPVLLRVDRPGRRRPPGRRRRPRPDPRTRPSPRRRAARRRSTGRQIHASDKERLSDFVDLDGPQRPGASRRAPERPQGDPDPALDGLGGPRARVRRRTAGSTPSSSRAGSRPGTSRRPGSSPSARGARVTSMTGAPWFDVAHSPASIGILAAPPAHHADAARRWSAGPILGRASGGVSIEPVEAPFARRTPAHSSRGVPCQRSSSTCCCADQDAVLGGPQPSEVAVEQGLVPVLAEGGGERHRPRPADAWHLPRRRLRRDGLEVAVARSRTAAVDLAPQPGEARDSRPTSRRRARASPGSRWAARPTSRGRRRRRR